MNGLGSHNFYYTSPKWWSELGESWHTNVHSWRQPGAAMLDFTPTAASEHSSEEEGMQTSSNRKPVATLQLSNSLYWRVCCTTAHASAPAHPFASWASPTIIKIGCNEKDWTLNYQVLPCALHTVGWQPLPPPANLRSACSAQKITSSEPFRRQRWSLAISVRSGMATVHTGINSFPLAALLKEQKRYPHLYAQLEALRGWAVFTQEAYSKHSNRNPTSPALPAFLFTQVLPSKCSYWQSSKMLFRCYPGFWTDPLQIKNHPWDSDSCLPALPQQPRVSSPLCD